jgi:putative phosphotransacetylase
MEILCESSMRHVHLTAEDLETLFDAGAVLEFERALSQPGQFLSKQRVTLVGPKREIQNVAVLGPVRSRSQVEISQTDAFTLGLKDVPVRQSGDLDGAPKVIIRTTSIVTASCIIAKRHVHLDPKTAKANGFTDGEIVKLTFAGERAATLDEAVVRVDKNFAPAVHLDSDEANAVMAGNTVTVTKK